MLVDMFVTAVTNGQHLGFVRRIRSTAPEKRLMSRLSASSTDTRNSSFTRPLPHPGHDRRTFAVLRDLLFGPRRQRFTPLLPRPCLLGVSFHLRHRILTYPARQVDSAAALSGWHSRVPLPAGWHIPHPARRIDPCRLFHEARHDQVVSHVDPCADHVAVGETYLRRLRGEWQRVRTRDFLRGIRSSREGGRDAQDYQHRGERHPEGDPP